MYPLLGHAARERYVLEFDDVHIQGYRGEPAILFLKKAFRQQYPSVELTDTDLRKVVLVAKSKKGHGEVQLRVGQWITESSAVAGRPIDFRDRRKITFDRVRFHNPSSSSQGPWQLQLQGNFIVRKIVVDLDNHRWRRPYYGRKHHYNKHHFNKRYYSRW
ncbi:MAG: hypothetical protein ACN4GW_06690 [Desulforhopalus sp.]